MSRDLGLVCRAVLLVTIVRWLLPASVESQEPARNRVFGEALGPGLVYSINYERDFSGRVGWRIGIGGLPASGFQYVLGLGMATVRVGEGRHAMYAGLGGGVFWARDVWIFERTDVWAGYLIASFGYQLKPWREGFLVRLSYTPLANAEGIALLWGGLAVGWEF